MSLQSQIEQRSEPTNVPLLNLQMDLNVVPEDDDVIITTNSKEVLNIDSEIKCVINHIASYLQPHDEVIEVVPSKPLLNDTQQLEEKSHSLGQKEEFLNLILKRQPFCYYSALWKLYYQFHSRAKEKENISWDDNCSVLANSTKLVHPSSLYSSFSQSLLSLPSEMQVNQCSSINQYLHHLLPNIAPNYHSGTFWSCLVQFLLLEKKEVEACKMAILAQCATVKNVDFLLCAKDDFPLFSFVVDKLKKLQQEAPWSDLAAQRNQFDQSKITLKTECNQSIDDSSLWQKLFELYKGEVERLLECQTAQHIHHLYHTVLEHFDNDTKQRLIISAAEWGELDFDLGLFALRKALIKFSKSRNKPAHLFYFAHKMYETLKKPSKIAADMLQFLSNFIQDHIIHSSFNPNYPKDESIWLLQSNITACMHGSFFEPVSKQQALQRAKDICDLGIQELGEESVPHRLVNEAAMLCLKITGQPAASRQVYAVALEKHPTSIDLWLNAAQFERTIRQFKQAVTVYEKALSVKQVSFDLAIWKDYIQFSLQREKLGNARSIYIRSLSQVAPSFVDSMWEEFLEFENNVRKKQAGEHPPTLLTLDQLKQAVIAQQPSLQVSQSQVAPQQTSSPKQADNAGTSLQKREAEDQEVPPVKKPKIEATLTGEEPRLALPTSYTEQPVEALPGYVQPPSKYQRPAFRTPENRPSQHSDNLSIESPFVEALMQPSQTSGAEEKPVFGAAPRTLASVSGSLTMEQIKLLEDAQKLLLQRQDTQAAPQPIDETPAPAPVSTPVITQQPQVSQPSDTSHLPPLLVQLSEVLQDPLIFDIVKSLQNIQILKEKEIQKGRHELKMNHKKMRDQLLQHHRELLNQATPTTYQQIHSQNTQQLRLHEQSCREELALYDRKAAEELERQTLEQQRVLQQAGVPGFFPSTNKADIDLHSQLLKLILSLAQELERDHNPAATQQRLHAQVTENLHPVQTHIPVQPVISPPIAAPPQIPVQPQIPQIPQLPPQLPIQSHVPQIPQLPPQLPVQPQVMQTPFDLLAGLLSAQPGNPMAPQIPVVNNSPQLSVQQITQMIGNLVSNTPVQSQGELIQQIQGYLPMLPSELQTHILQTLITTLQNQGSPFQPIQTQPDPTLLMASAIPLQPPPMSFPAPPDTIVLHGAQGPVTVPLSMLNQSLAFPQQPPPNMNQPPPQQRRNRPNNYRAFYPK